MKILALTRYDRLGASSRVRILQYISKLEAQGLRVDVQRLFSDHYVKDLYQGRGRSRWGVLVAYLRRFWILRTVYQYDALWIEKELFPGLPAFFERLLALTGVCYVVDYDDAVFHNYDLFGNMWARVFLNKKIAVVMRCARLVCVGNRYLEEYAQKASAKSVICIPSVVDTNRYQKIMRPENSIPIVGWVGTPSTVKYLAKIAPILADLSKEVPFLLRVVGAKFEYASLQVECVAWSEEKEVSLIQSFDVGIMPLDNSPWERGKCGYKLIQYMACGVPVIGSDVGVNSQIIADQAGYLAKEGVDWIVGLKMLLTDQVVRTDLGNKARARAVECYSVDATFPLIMSVWKTLGI